MKTVIVAVLLMLVLPVAASAHTAPGAPGATAKWTEADKDGYGTSTATRTIRPLPSCPTAVRG